MVESTSLKQQRDRFLAFSFASADLFLEVGSDQQVVFALGAAKSLTGVDHKDLMNKNWLDLFAKKDHAALNGLREKAREGERCGPLNAVMDEELGKGQKVIVTGIKMPGTDSFYITIGFTSMLMARLAEMMGQPDKDLPPLQVDKDSFYYRAQDALNMARDLGQDLEVSLFDLGDPNAWKAIIGDEKWPEWTENLAALLGPLAYDGQTFAELDKGRYSIIHEAQADVAALCDQIADMAKDISPEGEDLAPEFKTITADLETLDEQEAMKALIYTINEFERKGTEFNIETLNTSFKSYVSANAQKIQQLKTMIAQTQFELQFHPIIDLKTRELSHFEMLTRFHDGSSAREWFAFAEDVKLAESLDNAVIDRALNYLMYKSAGHGFRFAINLTGQALQNDSFIKSLLDKTERNKDIANRIIFEITQSSFLQDLEKAGKLIRELQERKFKVCLDDFGSGADSLQHLQKLPVNYVKIDGAYTPRVLESERDAKLVKSIISLCKELGITPIAERIETEDQAHKMRRMGVQFGQGYLFSKVTAKPDYIKPS